MTKAELIMIALQTASLIVAGVQTKLMVKTREESRNTDTQSRWLLRARNLSWILAGWVPVWLLLRPGSVTRWDLFLMGVSVFILAYREVVKMGCKILTHTFEMREKGDDYLFKEIMKIREDLRYKQDRNTTDPLAPDWIPPRKKNV
ncbi:MAG: hypothetical protein HC904_16665 [Blastochloris sp.]|nr:hypothetical protein [Blastochloris sp.]